MTIANLDLLKYFRPLFAVEPDTGADEDVSGGASGESPVPDSPPERTVDPLDDIIAKATAKLSEDGEVSKDADATAKDEPGRKRGADGRFATPSATDAPGEPGPAEAATTVPTVAAQPAQTVQSLPVPDNWPAEHKAMFSKLPSEGQKFLLDRHAEMQADYTRKTQENAEFRKTADPLVQAVSPFTRYLESLGRQPAATVNLLLGTEHLLRTGTPQQKTKMLAQLSVDYGVNPADVHNLIQGGHVNRPMPFNPQHQQEIQQTNQRLAAIEQQNVQREQAEQGRVAASQVESFRSAKTADGQPKYPQYERVIDSMSDWFGSNPKVLEGKSMTQMLELGYERFGKPIDDTIKEQIASRQKQATEANAAAVAKARGAAPVRSNGSTPRGSSASRDINAIIDGAMAKVGFQG